jgi:hypothetical protein
VTGGVALGLGVAWLVVSLLATLGVAWYAWRLRGPAPAEGDLPAPGVAVLVPVRGAEGLPDFLRCLLAQDYPGPWRAVFAVEDAADPAHAPLAALCAAQPGRCALVVAGRATGRGQKVQNLLAAWDAASPAEILVTLDADTRPRPDWLARLTRPLRGGAAEIASGYRWQVPAPGASLLARLAALADRSVATTPRIGPLNLAWGGSTAITTAAAARIGLRAAWAGAVSDDFALRAAARRAGLTIFAPLRVLVASPLAGDARALLSFGRRQYLLVRWHAPLHWAIALLALLPPVAGVLALLPAAAAGEAAALAMLGAGLALQQLRFTLRDAIARRILPEPPARPSDRLLLPAAQPLHALLLLSSLVGRRLRWAGRDYPRDRFSAGAAP